MVNEDDDLHDELLTPGQAAAISFPVYGPKSWRECGRAVYATQIDDDGRVWAVGLSHQMLVDGQVAHLSVFSQSETVPKVDRSIRWSNQDLVEVDVTAYLPDTLISRWVIPEE